MPYTSAFIPLVHQLPSSTRPPSASTRPALPFAPTPPRPAVLPHPPLCTLPVSPSLAPARTPHRHSDATKAKISAANRGNVPWNKGLKHSDSTKKKIAEATRRAMMDPAMRQRMKDRARGRRHSEATKLKIRETARAKGGAGVRAVKMKRTPLPFVWDSSVVKRLNQNVDQIVDKSVAEGRSSALKGRKMSEETKRKLSARITQMWGDPSYRRRVAKGMERSLENKRKEGAIMSTTISPPPERLTKRRKPDHTTSSSGTYHASSASLSSSSTQQTIANPHTSEAMVMDPNLSKLPLNGLHVIDSKKKQELTSREKENLEENEEETGMYAALDEDFVLDDASLVGFSKEDLGIHGAHAAGRIDMDPGKMFGGMNETPGMDMWPVNEENFGLGNLEDEELEEEEVAKGQGAGGLNSFALFENRSVGYGGDCNLSDLESLSLSDLPEIGQTHEIDQGDVERIFANKST